MAKRARSKKVTRQDSRAERKHARGDGFYNEYSGHGTTRDRRGATSHNAVAVTDQAAISMWRGDDIMARIIEMLPREAVRRGITLKVSGGEDGKKSNGKEVAEAVMADVERLNVLEKVKVGGQYERAYGGSAIFPVLTGAVGDLAEPLDEYLTGIVRIEALHVLEARELRPASWYREITHPKFRQPETYRLWPLAGASGTSIASEIIHESRLIAFPGIRVSNQLQAGQRPGWGDSVVMRVQEVVSDFGLAWGSAATLLHEFATGVLKMENLTDLLSTKGGKKIVEEKLALIEMVKSTINARVIGTEDEYSRQSTPVAGLEGLLVQLAQRLAAAADMPVTQLMGMSPAGMNATGESDTRGWYDRVAALQAVYRAIVEWLIRLIMLQTDGPTGGKEPESWSTEWVPLWQPTEKEIADTRKVVADTDKVYYDMGAVKASTVAKSRWGGDTYSADMHYDPTELQALAEQDNLANTDPAQMSDEELAALGVDPAAYRASVAAAAAPTATAAPDPTAAAPDAVAPGSAPAAPENIQTSVLNGAQVSSLVAVVTAVVDGEIPRDAAQKIIELAYQVTPEVALALLGDPEFEATQKAPAVPFGGAAPFGAPPAAPAAPGDEKKPDEKDAAKEPDPEDADEPAETEAEPDAEDKAEPDEPAEPPPPKAKAKRGKKA